MAAEGSGSVPSQDRVSPGTCFPLQPKLSFEQSKKEAQRAAPPGPPAEGLPQGRQEQEADKQAALNKGTAPWVVGPLPRAPCASLDPCPWSPGAQPGVWVCSAVGIVPPRTKSPAEEDVMPAAGVARRSTGGMANGLGSRVGLGQQTGGCITACSLLGTPGLFQHVPPTPRRG